jgi:prephenate dehydrogenase
MGYTLTIVGAAGKMGKWFFEYFNSLKNNAYHSDINCSLIIDKILLYDVRDINYVSNYKDENIVVINDVSKSIKTSDIVLLCIPINDIISTISNNITLFKPESIIIEISSIKTAIHNILSDVSIIKNIVTLCIHPMFGPGASIFSSNKIIFIPVNKNNYKIETNLLNKIFPFFEKIIIEDPGKHDLAISVIISLIYFINLVFSKFLLELSTTKEFKFEDNIMNFFKKISGSTFKIQSLLSESILTDDISLFLSLFINNGKSYDTINKYGQFFNQLLEKIEKKDIDYIKNYIASTKNGISNDIDINKSYDILYKFLNS